MAAEQAADGAPAEFDTAEFEIVVAGSGAAGMTAALAAAHLGASVVVLEKTGRSGEPPPVLEAAYGTGQHGAAPRRGRRHPAPDTAVNFASRSRIGNFTPPARSPRSISGLRACWAATPPRDVP
jgi:2-polyprenyl-6-methoxyphenol hydroxylase-like FAD-dependent oxidoreductase